MLTSYTPGSSMVISEMMLSIDEFTSQNYPIPFITSICQSGYNTIESGESAATADQWGTGGQTQASFTSNTQSYIAAQIALISPCAKLRMGWTLDGIVRAPSYLFAITQGIPSPSSSTWTAPFGVATVFQAMKNSASNLSAIAFIDDEIQGWGALAMQGPIRFGTATAQNWLLSISSNGTGTCTASTSTAGWPSLLSQGSSTQYSFFGPQFAVTGSATANMNSTSGNLYTLTAINATSFSFNCTGVASGVYNASNDPGLTIQNLAAGGWFTNGVTGIVTYDAWANFVNQANSVSGRTPMAGDSKGAEPLAAVVCWENNCGQSITVGGNAISRISDFADIYWDHGTTELYLPSRSALNSDITDNISQGANLQEGNYLRSLYGTAFDPTLPLTTITTGSPTAYAFSGYPIPIASCMGNTITFTQPHLLANLVPGLSRMTGSGSTDPNCNNNFVILSNPSPTTLTVAYAATKTICTDTGSGSCAYNNAASAKLTFADGSCFGVGCGSSLGTNFYEIETDGATEPMGLGNSRFDYGTSAIGTGFNPACGGTPSTAVTGKRGQTFTLSGITGSAASYFNGTTFVYDIENFAVAADAGGGTGSCSNTYIREIPVLNGTGGSGAIVADNLLVRGRGQNAIYAFDAGIPGGGADPAWVFGMWVEAMNLRTAGARQYQMSNNPQGFNPQATVGPPLIKAGWVGSALSNAAIYGQSSSCAASIDNCSQLYYHPNVENDYSVPDFYAGSTASLMWTRVQKYYLGATPLNSPDYGPELDCSAYTSSSGSLVIALNASNGPETRTVALTPYETAGQNIIRYTARYNGIGPVKIITAGTATDIVTLQGGDAVFYLFPVAFSAEYQAPSIAVRLADVANATDVVVRFSYDFYNLDAANNAYDCGGSGLCVVPVDPQIGAVHYRIIYRNASGAILATSDKQKL